MTSRAQRTTLLAAATALALAASGCSGSADDSTTTPPMLAAAVDAHTDAPLRAAAELPEGSQGVVEGDVTVEVSLDREVGDNAHVLLAVTRGTPFGVSAAELADLCESLGPCEEVDGATLVFENGSPESDPGIAYAWMERGDVTVWAYGYGPFIEQDPAQRSEEVAALAETLVGVVSDPGVGFTSAAAYVEGAQEICDGPWLDWYGQGNGSPEPEDSTDWC